MRKYLIAPSILSADFSKLGDEIESVMEAGADIIYFDVMDNHFVPNLTIGPLVCESLRKSGIIAPIDVHLMTRSVDSLIQNFTKAGATYITFHPEGSDHVDRSLQLINSLGCKAGLVFNPVTPIDHLKYVMDKIDIILLMSVNPGFGGQEFIHSAYGKLRETRKLIMDKGYYHGPLRFKNTPSDWIYGVTSEGSFFFSARGMSNLVEEIKPKKSTDI